MSPQPPVQSSRGAGALFYAAAIAATVLADGCFVSESCKDYGTCPRGDAGGSVDAPAGQDAGESAETGASEDAPQDSACPSTEGGVGTPVGDGSGADGTADASVCDPTEDPSAEPCVIDDAYGVFVAPPASDPDASTSAADGSMAHPYPTIGQALSSLGSKTRVYVCNGLYGEQVTVTSPVNLYGGLSCAAGPAGLVWSYVGGRAQVTSPATPALSVTGVDSGEVTIEDLSFAAPSAVSPAASSIAALVASSSVRLVRVALSAGSGAEGAPGADGITSPNYTGSAPTGGPQVWVAGAGFVPISGGPGGVNQCTQFGASAGGDGGLGCTTGVGTAGSATPSAPASDGRDGLPRGWILPDGGTIEANHPGADGTAGDGGAPTAAKVYGTLTPSGWIPSPGGDGDPGNPGQGGAGASDPLYEPPGTPNTCSTPTEDIGGGGGGAGGCGGSGGKGGGGGGASIALASIDSVVDLAQCELSASTGGAGGAGGAGQDGQAGGAGGDDGIFPQAHVFGAAGGNGAGGSGGAGGTGGVSVGVLSVGGQVSCDPATVQSITVGAAGAGGPAGAGGKHSTAGTLLTGSDGNPGAVGGAGMAGAFVQGM